MTARREPAVVGILARMAPSSVNGLAPNISEAFLRSLEARIDVPANREAISVLSPFTEEEIGSVPQATAADVEDAVARARVAGVEWAARKAKDRARVLSRFHDLVIDRADIALDLIQLEAGKARVPAFEEVYDTVATTRYYVKTGPKLLKPKRRRVSLPGFTKAWEHHHPVGVVGSIIPWNFPFTLAISDIVPALIAGNSVVLKPDQRTPYSAI